MAAKLLVGLIRVYQTRISPLFPPTCRFTPTCSQYAVDAIRNRGPLVGLFLTTLRIAKCHPWHPGGHDPPPS
nr:membrane protein insertion efficiency factor YidD [Stieleria tagensis]